MNAELSIIPQNEVWRYGKLTDPAKEEYTKVCRAVLAICKDLEKKRVKISHALKAASVALGISHHQLRRKLDEWRASGDWKVFVNKAMAGRDWWDTDLTPLPEAFVDAWFALRGRNQRAKCKPAYRKLVRQLEAWRAGDVTKRIAGFDEPPVNAPGKQHPPGWSYENLQRLKQRKAELALMTIGTAAALRLLPPIPGTRVGARFLEYVTIDDVWQDRKVTVPGYPMPVRLLQMGAMDYASAVYLKFGLRPELPADDGTRSRLKERDAMELIAMLLWEFGYPRDYDMHLICERGTATVREAEAQALYQLSGGRIKVCYTSMEGGLVLVWQESSTGNSRGKGYHESWHNLFHNEMGSLRGQVGKDNAHQPAALLGMEREAKNLITAQHFLTDDQKRRIKLPFSDLHEAHWETLEVIERINRRRDHECEGFDKLQEWILPGIQNTPQPESALLTLAQCDLERIHLVPRVESPWERLLKLRSREEFHQVPEFMLPRLYLDWHAKEKIAGDRFQFTKAGRTYSFKPANPDEQLPENNQEYLGYCSEGDPDCVHLTKLDGGFVATWIRERRIARGDQKAVAQAIREKTTILNNAIGTVRRVNKDWIEGEAKRMRENETVLNEAGLIHQKADVTRLNENIPAGAVELNAAVASAAAARKSAKQDAKERETLSALADEAILANQITQEEKQ